MRIGKLDDEIYSDGIYRYGQQKLWICYMLSTRATTLPETFTPWHGMNAPGVHFTLGPNRAPSNGLTLATSALSINARSLAQPRVRSTSYLTALTLLLVLVHLNDQAATNLTNSLTTPRKTVAAVPPPLALPSHPIPLEKKLSPKLN